MYQGQDECPQGLEHTQTVQETSADDSETQEEDNDIDVVELVESQAESTLSGEQDDEMDPDD